MPAQANDITLDELERLIKLLGLLASTHDGEVLAAARHAVKWVAEKQTSWEALLVPEPLPAVAGVAAPRDPDVLEAAHTADRAQAFKNGYQAGLQAMAAQLKAQANMGQQPPRTAGAWTSAFSTMAAQAPGGLSGGASGGPGAGQGQTTQAAQAPPGGSGGASWNQPGAANPYPAGSWQDIAWALLNRDAQGIPGVFRGSREQGFVADILGRGFPRLTQAQEDWLRAIAARSALTW